MTNEEASIIVGNIPINGDGCYSIPEYQEAKAMAIEVLEQQPCEDAVSRQAVLDIIIPYCQDDDGSVENTGDLRNALDDIESLPPVTPKEKIGHWFVDERPESDREVICSNCEQPVFKYHKLEFDYRPKFCPNCGAKMQEVGE